MFLLQSSPKTIKSHSVSTKLVKNFKQIFMTPELTEEERWDLYYDYSAVTAKTASS
ncbi:hypothetical protein ACN08Z_00090 [Rothia sp. P7181]|uniref:hypothetical protein n=1 Tax=unclassified Rothia (in: high G+C Gram-positive bacteria) TaxID=2689056 RepID=UPI003AC2A1FD